MFAGIRRSLEQTMRGAVLGSLALLALVVGLGFLTTAALIALAQAQGMAIAALIIGCVYTGAAIILLAFARAKPTPPPKPAPAPESDLPPLAQAFLTGMTAGTRAAQKRRN